MGRSGRWKVLSVRMNGEHVGEWRRSPGGAHELAFAESWLASTTVRPISMSFPLRPHAEPYRKGVVEFFDNLLPDSRGNIGIIERRIVKGADGVRPELQRERADSAVRAPGDGFRDACTPAVRGLRLPPS